MSAPGYQISRDPTAVVGTRTAAWIVDILLYLVLIVGVLGPTPLSPLAEYAEVPDGMSMDTACERVRDLEDVGSCFVIGDRVYFTDSGDAAIQIIGWLAYVGLIYIVWQGITGLTPGKLLFGLRTVGEDGRAPGMLKAFVRSVLWIVDGLPCIPLVGFITALTSTGHRRVGDMAAKTYVVGKADMGQPVMVPGATAYGTPTVYGTQPGYGAQVPSSAPWGTPPGAPGAPGAPAGPGAPSWGTPPGAPPTPGSPYPPADSRPAPPTSPYGTPATPGAPTAPPPAPAAPGPEGTPSGGRPTPEAPGPTAPAPAPSPDASAFGESSDPADADLPSSEEAEQEGEQKADAAGSSGDAAAPESTESTESPESPEPADQPAAAPTEQAPAPAPPTAEAGDTATVEQTYSPQWDAARGAYIQWDPNRSRWLQWDDGAKEWKAI